MSGVVVTNGGEMIVCDSADTPDSRFLLAAAAGHSSKAATDGVNSGVVSTKQHITTHL